jgi:hypothetical protein
MSAGCQDKNTSKRWMGTSRGQGVSTRKARAIYIIGYYYTYYSVSTERTSSALAPSPLPPTLLHRVATYLDDMAAIVDSLLVKRAQSIAPTMGALYAGAMLTGMYVSTRLCQYHSLTGHSKDFMDPPTSRHSSITKTFLGIKCSRNVQ